MRVLILLCALFVTGLAQAQLMEPEGPLQRDKVRLQGFLFEITLWQLPESGADAPLHLPFVVDGPWSLVDPASLSVEVWSGATLIDRRTPEDFKKPDALGELDVRMTMPSEPSWPLLVRLQGQAATYSAQLNETIAGRIPWPVSWPSATGRFLKPQTLIESNDPAVMAAVEATVGVEPRDWGPPLAVAKRLIQAACANWNSDGSHLLYGPQRTVRGLNVHGALAGLKAVGGSESDLVCLSVAVLRAAGIPARPVIALGAHDSERKDALTVSAEFFLPEAGWIPFDPDLLRRRGVGSHPIEQVWRGLGDCPHLDDLVPLFWTFGPDGGRDVYEAWAGWSWARMAPQAPFPLLVTTGEFRLGDKVLITGQAHLHSSLNVRSSSKGRPNEPIPSPWRTTP
jgi:transglutaminase-like putative cysteine protease